MLLSLKLEASDTSDRFRPPVRNSKTGTVAAESRVAAGWIVECVLGAHETVVGGLSCDRGLWLGWWDYFIVVGLGRDLLGSDGIGCGRGWQRRGRRCGSRLWLRIVAAREVMGVRVPAAGEVAALVGEFPLVLELDGGECAEEEIAGVDQDGGAARGDAVLRDEGEEFGDEFVDIGGGGEFFEAGGELGGEVDDGADGGLKMSVVAAVEAGLRAEG